MRKVQLLAIVAGILALTCAAARVRAQEERRFILPEQRHLEIRDPSQFHPARLPAMPPPVTVSNPLPRDADWSITLDDAIRIALANANVVRVVAGTTAASSGATIYDPAIINTTIDQQRARFDPTISSVNAISHTDVPQAALLAAGPPPVVGIVNTPINGFQSTDSISKTFITGGTISANVTTTRSQIEGPAGALTLNPQTATSPSLSFTQPLLQGAGAKVNLAPILIARLNTERSFFQMKDSVETMVEGVAQAYWGVVFARVDVWARRQQVDQGKEALDRAQAQQTAGLGNAADTAQARVSYEGFRAQLIGSEANLLNQEYLLRNVMGLPPSDARRLMPVTRPTLARVKPDWNGVVSLASQYRPDIIELKLVLEADEQQYVINRNGALPQLSINGMYSWNGLEGKTPDGADLSGEGQSAQLGVNFSMPLGLRQGRANMRQSELTLARDRANVDQAVFSATHTLAGNYRNLDQYYEQFIAYGRTREAAQANLLRQFADYRSGRKTLYINVLQAITDWGNAVSSESQAVTQYNTELARLERETGTILETHGVRFIEERYQSIGPKGRWCPPVLYPLDSRPEPNADRMQPEPTLKETNSAPIPLPPVETLPGPLPNVGPRGR